MEHYFLTAAIILLATVGLLSCDKDLPDTSPAPAKTETDFVHSINIEGSTYVSVFKGMDVGSLNTDNVLVMPKGVFSFVHKRKVYITSTKRIYKYAQRKGKLVQEGNTILLPSGVATMYIIFAFGHRAYVPCHRLGKVTIVNPTTTEKVGKVDLAEYSLREATGDNNPEPAASVIRDGILYMALSQMKSTYIYEAGAYVALIDTKTDKPIRVVSDPRVSMAFGESPVGGPFIDERDDTCFYCVAMSGYQPSVKEGFLCIKRGQADFDESYCLTLADVNLVGVKDNEMSYAYVKVYGGNGKVYAYPNMPGVVNNPPDHVRNRCFQPFGINLYNKSCIKLDLSATAGWVATLCKSGNDIIFGMFTDQGMGYSVYHPAIATYEILKVETSGTPYVVHESRQPVYISSLQEEQ